MKTKKKIVASSLVIIMVALAGWMIYSSVKKLKKKEEMSASISEVPQFVFLNVDSSAVSVNASFTEHPLVIIYFNSECDYCREEAQTISDSIVLFDGIELLFISMEPLGVIEDFAEEKALENHNHVAFGQIDETVLNDVLGIITAPQLFIYNREGKLTKQFKGSTKIEAIIKYANQE
jgi:peroxiredoxin